ncbi:MAG: aldehyde dehydrogenase family protein [Deltaproteobacteria bacterium]|nr:aldehyde dehydrogenase family protein [Deltaproteobacteria bacterium]
MGTLVEELLARYREPVPLWINGAWAPSEAGGLLTVTNPATGAALATVHEARGEDIDRAVKAARGAFEGAWGKTSPAQRQRLLWRVAELLDQRRDELATVECLNNGKTLREAQKGDLPGCSEVFRYFSGWATKLHGETIPVEGEVLCYTQRAPVGVCGQIVPWNYPLLMACWKVAPALAAGNTVVLKPSEFTPLTALCLGELCKAAGIPDGVVNVVPGYGDVAGEALARHPDVDKVAFTGSPRTARRLLVASAETNLKKLSLELGGKSPMLVFPDADLDQAARWAQGGIFSNKGEVCSASSRLLCHASVKDALVAKLAEKARRMTVGDPLNVRTQLGALVSERQLNAVLGHIARATAEGARLVTGGQRDTEGDKARGFFLQPTIFEDVKPAMALAQEEVFGPVLAVLTFTDEDEAVRIANGTTYGLAAGVFTRDVARAHRVARRLQAGTVWVNMWNGFDAAAPFGGFRQSGWGREQGMHALELYTQARCVWVPTA